ncbi:hypothetical protein [Paenibacillus sp. FSL R7-0331]|uniref:hypothetical protein n=1 Tax=Paenibacillus sp. FSL R7-0331 TaxID=1536773 RepID=UPI0004F9223E|nr:hypothetical protein [Paenibacillus sp. FSL R7-0331]AIQ54559.1 hypothetical protein R70331_25630 [Paenibacillus sp. FSL R7-0331]
MRANDTITLIGYALSLICIVYITASMHVYFRKKYRQGVVGMGLVLGMLMFTAYALERLLGFVIRLGKTEGWSGHYFRLLQDWGWTIGVIGTTVTLIALAVLVQGRDLSLFFERKGRK